MTAILKVDTIQDTSGNNIINENANTVTIGKAGDTVNVVGTLQNDGAALVTGKILQVVNTNSVGTAGDISTTSASYVTTGLSVSITPISASSKLYVELVGNAKFYQPTDVGDNGVAFKIYRDGTSINSNAGDFLFYRSDAAAQNHHAPITISHYVNATSTSSTTFTLFYADLWGGTGYYSRDWGTHQFTVMEIAA